MTEETNDYLVDGLLYCGKCKTPKQCKIGSGKEIIMPIIPCRCEKERKKKEREILESNQRKDRIERLRRAGLPERNMHAWTFANDDESNSQASLSARNYVNRFPELKESGRGLLFYGSVGTGKSYLAACIVNALIDKGIRCLMTDFGTIVREIQSQFEGRQEYIERFSRYDLLAIDDFAAERDTEYMSEIIYSVIESRYRSGLPLVITTNLTAEELKNPASAGKQRIYSRLYEMCIPVEVSGKDRRRNKMRQTFADYGELFGKQKPKINQEAVKKIEEAILYGMGEDHP